MTNLDLCYTPASELARLYRSKELSPVDVVQNSLNRIEDVNPTLNCFCFTYPEEALDQATALGIPDFSVEQINSEPVTCLL